MHDAAGHTIQVGDTVGGTTSGRYQATIIGTLTKLGKGQVKVKVAETGRPYDVKIGDEKWISADRVFLVRAIDPVPLPELTDAHGERLADAYNLGIKAEGLREFADQLDAAPRRNPTMDRVAALARTKAQDLDAEAETLATTDVPELTGAQRLAEQVIRHHVGNRITHLDVEAFFGTPGADQYVPAAFSADSVDPHAYVRFIDGVVDLARKATVTASVAWPAGQDGEQAEGGQ